jgi:hypothetical protein
VGDKEIKKLISIKQSEWWVSWEREMMRISHILIIFYYYFFLNLCMGYRMWGSIWGEICPILLFFFSEFVCGLSPVCGLLFSQFFFFFFF